MELRLKYPQVMLKTWLKISGLAKSLYYEWKEKLSESSNKDEVLIQKIFQIVEDSKGRYGYRCVTMVLQNQGFHYQHQSWIQVLKEHGIKQSMSRKGNCLDNSAMENFIGTIVIVLNQN